jgi:predicted O-methyltransferase YrrM
MAPNLTSHYAAVLRQRVFALPPEPSADELYEVLRTLGRWRSRMLANTYLHHEGAKIRSGPFAGMEYVSAATEGALVPRLLGTYESELHPYLAAFAKEGIETVIDVGCAEGYYAIGLARLMPQATVHAYDIDPAARAACAELAAKNGVAERVRIGEAFAPEGFEAFAGQRVLVMVDAEGAELEVLRPDLAPALAGMSLIVETHDVYRKGALEEIVRRFAPTHQIVLVRQQPKVFDQPAWLQTLPHLDQLLAVWEWRLQPTPWLVMRPKG